MKSNYTETQYIQLAKEQFCHALGEVPFISDIEVLSMNSRQTLGDFRVLTHFSDADEVLEFCVEVKSRGEKRFVNAFMGAAAQQPQGVHYLFMAPYISETSAQALRDQKYGYMDLSGNCYILAKHIMIYVSGQPNKYIEKRPKKNYFSKNSSAASAIMRTILDNPTKVWQVKGLANMTGKAIGTVSNVKNFLLDHAWAKETAGGFQLYNIKEMLYTWSKDYQDKDTRSFEYYSLDTIPDMENAIAEWNERHGTAAVLGGFAAAVRYAPVVRYNKIHVYVEQQDVDEFVKDLELQPVTAGGNLILIIPHDETPCMFSKRVNNDLITSPTQTVIDLLTHGGRGEEAANAVIMKEFIQVMNID